MEAGILGRRRELDALAVWLEAARAGAGRLVLCVGEPGIGKTRLAQEAAGIALAGGTTVAWGRCVEAEGSPPLWPWRQVLGALGAPLEPPPVLAAESPADRFQVFDRVAASVRAAAAGGPLLVILDDVHGADEPSLLVLRHLALQLPETRLTVLATFRDAEPGSLLPGVLAGLHRAPAVERFDLQGFGLAEVREELARAGAADAGARAAAVLDVTGGNPFFVRELARAMADGTWRPDRPPRTVLDLVAARLDRVSPECRRLVQTAAVIGRDFPLAVVAATAGTPAAALLPLVDEATAHGLLTPVDRAGASRFVHALAREAVETSLPTSERAALHRAVALALEATYAADLSEHLGEIARHWAELAPMGDAAPARQWAVRAAEDAVRRLAYEEGARRYRAALTFGGGPVDDAERARLLIALARAAYLSGHVEECVAAAVDAASAASRAGSPELVAEAALAAEVTADPAMNALVQQLCEQAVVVLGGTGHEALRCRLLAQLAHLAFYDGDQPRLESLSAAARDAARATADDRARAAACHARKEACGGPAGRDEREALAAEMLALGSRAASPKTAMWGELWRIEAQIERGELAAAAASLPRLHAAAERVGGPVSAWHHDRVAACIAQAQGRYADAAAIARRGMERMQSAEPGPARGTYFALHCAMAGHIGVSDAVAPFVTQAFTPLPRFKHMSPLMRAQLLLCAGQPEEAAASYEQAGPAVAWAPNRFFLLVSLVVATMVAVELGRQEDLPELVERLAPYRGEHVSGDGVLYLGPVELALGRATAALGRIDGAIDDLSAAVELAHRAGARGFVAEARFRLAMARLARNGPGDRATALTSARQAHHEARALGMAAYVDRTSALVTSLSASGPAPLTARETEVAQLVAHGLTNRQIADRLVISERTAQNHVQHILTKLGFTRRSQIAAWQARAGASR